MHTGVLEWGRQVITPEMVEGKHVLEVGSHDFNGSMRPDIEALHPAEYVGVDIVHGPGVDIVMSATQLLKKFGPERWDLIVTTEMLEHCLEWQEAMFQMKHSLKIGGWLVLSTRSPGYPQHDFPADYWRFSQEVISKALDDLAEVRVYDDPGFKPSRGDGCSDGWDELPEWADQPGVFAIGQRGVKVRRPAGAAESAPGYIPRLDEAFIFDPILHELETGSTLKLDIGAGGRIFKRTDMTWKSVDKYVEADYTADMWDLPFEDNTVDAIWCSHVLEHAEMKQVIPTLEEWFRVLKPGGTCTIIVPDFDYIAQYWLTNGPATGNGMVFGSQAHPGEFHKVGFTKDSLAEDLTGVGFEITKAEVLYTEAYTQYSIWVEAMKPVA